MSLAAIIFQPRPSHSMRVALRYVRRACKSVTNGSNACIVHHTIITHTALADGKLFASVLNVLLHYNAYIVQHYRVL